MNPDTKIIIAMRLPPRADKDGPAINLLSAFMAAGEIAVPGPHS